MSPCECLPDALATVSFAHGIELLRCARHEQQAWAVDGRIVERTDALSRLRTLFLEHREQRPATAAAPARRRTRVVHLAQRRRAGSEPAGATAPLVGDARDDERLTALLNSRGLHGSWAVA